MERIEKDLKKKGTRRLMERAVLEKCKAASGSGKAAAATALTPEERRPIGRIFVLVAETDVVRVEFGRRRSGELETAVERHKLGAFAGRRP